MACKDCGRGRSNSIHRSRNHYGFHVYREPDPEPYQPTLEDRIMQLERQVDELKLLLSNTQRTEKSS